MDAASLDTAPMAVISAEEGGARDAPAAGRVARSFRSSYTMNWMAPCDTCRRVGAHIRVCHGCARRERAPRGALAGALLGPRSP